MTTQSRLGTLAILAAVGLAATVSGCVIDDSNPSYSGNCTPTDIYVDWQLLDVNGTPITCAAAGVATMQATVNGVPWSQTCPPADSFGTIDAPITAFGTYTVSVDAFDSTGNPREKEQKTIDLQITACGISEVPSPAPITVPN
jgi:hypothetical protein